MVKQHLVLFVTIFTTILSKVAPNPEANSTTNSTYPPFTFPPSGYICTEEIGQQYLNWLEYMYSEKCFQQVLAEWNYATNITKETEAASVRASLEFLKVLADIQKEIKEKCPNWPSFKNPEIKKQFKYYSLGGPGEMCNISLAEMENMRSEMESLYSTLTVCDQNNQIKCDNRLDPEIEEKLNNVSNPEATEYYWTVWHDKMSENISPFRYWKYVILQNEMAKANGFKDMSEMWLSSYDDDTPCWSTAKFKMIIFKLWEDLFPMYKILHAYVRMKLRQIPKFAKLIDKCGYLPAYITGNMWAQDWAALDNITKPFPNAPTLDVTQALIDNGYTPLKMFQASDKFFTSMGLFPMTDTFWEKSMIERPTDREVVCHASAWDFCLGKYKGEINTDFRIKQCTQVNMEDFITTHHEMGHIQYFMQYADQPAMFREGANSGFHEAVGDTLALAVITPNHCQCVLGFQMGLPPSACEPGNNGSGGNVTETDINFLYMGMLVKVAFFPFALSMDSWRWDVFEGKVDPDDYNRHWWKIRMKNQGIKPPTDRNKPNLFDPAAKYHIAANVEYLRYFISNIIQFQFYEAMCIAAGQYDPKNPNTKPLYQCDFNGSKKAGKLLGDMLKLGYSRGWPDALEAITGNRTMSTNSIKTYFKPALDYMEQQLKANGETPGFGDNCKDVENQYYKYH